MRLLVIRKMNRGGNRRRASAGAAQAASTGRSGALGIHSASSLQHVHQPAVRSGVPARPARAAARRACAAPQTRSCDHQHQASCGYGGIGALGTRSLVYRSGRRFALPCSSPAQERATQNPEEDADVLHRLVGRRRCSVAAALPPPSQTKDSCLMASACCTADFDPQCSDQSTPTVCGCRRPARRTRPAPPTWRGCTACRRQRRSGVSSCCLVWVIIRWDGGMETCNHVLQKRSQRVGCAASTIAC